MITSDERMEKYRKLSALLAPLYSAPESGTVLYSIYENNISHEYEYQVFGNLIGDTILGFHTTDDLPTLLQKEVGVSADDAMRIVADLQEFLAPVIAREKGEVNPNHAELEELQETFTPKPAAAQVENIISPTHPESVAIENTQKPVMQTETAVQPMRTMEADMTRIHGYGAYRAQFPDEVGAAAHTEETIRSASQEDLLVEKPKLAEMPNYEKDA